MWEVFEHRPPPPPKRRPRPRPLPSRRPAAHDDMDEDSEGQVLTPRTQRRRYQRYRRAVDRYHTPVHRSNRYETFDFDGAEVFTISPTDYRSASAMWPVNDVYFTDTSKEAAEDDSSVASRTIVPGGKDFPISLDGCVFDAGGMILDTLTDLASDHRRLLYEHFRQETSSENDVAVNHDEVFDRALREMDESLIDEQTLDAVLEMASGNSPIKTSIPDFQRVLSLDLLEEEHFRRSVEQSGDKSVGRPFDSFSSESPDLVTNEQLDQSDSREPETPTRLVRSRESFEASLPLTPTVLRSPNVSDDPEIPQQDNNCPITPSALRSPACSIRDEPKDIGPPEDDPPQTSHNITIEPSYTPMDAPESRCCSDGEGVRLPDAPPRLTIQIPSDDETWNYETSESADSNVVGNLHCEWTGEGQEVRLLSSRSSLEAETPESTCESLGTGDDASVEKSAATTPTLLLEKQHSVKDLEDTAAFLERLAVAPSPREVMEAREYLAKLTATPSPKQLKEAQTFFAQILEPENKSKNHKGSVPDEEIDSNPIPCSSVKGAPRPESPIRTTLQNPMKQSQYFVQENGDYQVGKLIERDAATPATTLGRKSHSPNQQVAESFSRSSDDLALSFAAPANSGLGRARSRSDSGLATDACDRNSLLYETRKGYATESSDLTEMDQRRQKGRSRRQFESMLENDRLSFHMETWETGRIDKIHRKTNSEASTKKPSSATTDFSSAQLALPPLDYSSKCVGDTSEGRMDTVENYDSARYDLHSGVLYVDDHTLAHDWNQQYRRHTLEFLPLRKSGAVKQTLNCANAETTKHSVTRSRRQSPLRSISCQPASGEHRSDGSSMDRIIEIVSDDSSMVCRMVPRLHEHPVTAVFSDALVDDLSQISHTSRNIDTRRQSSVDYVRHLHPRSVRGSVKGLVPVEKECAAFLCSKKETREDLIEIVSIADSSVDNLGSSSTGHVCVVKDPWALLSHSQSHKATKFPPFGVLPDIPEVFSDEECGPGTELYERKRERTRASQSGTRKSTLPSASSQGRQGGPEEIERTSLRRQAVDESKRPGVSYLSDITTTDIRSMPRMGGPERLITRQGVCVDSAASCKQEYTQHLHEPSSSGESVLSRRQNDALHIAHPRFHVPPPRPDRKKRQSRDCPASSDVHTAASDRKEDAPGVTLLGIFQANHSQATAKSDTESHRRHALEYHEPEKTAKIANEEDPPEQVDNHHHNFHGDLLGRYTTSEEASGYERRPNSSNEARDKPEANSDGRHFGRQGTIVGEKSSECICRRESEVSTASSEERSSINIASIFRGVGATLTEPKESTHHNQLAVGEGTFDNPLTVTELQTELRDNHESSEASLFVPENTAMLGKWGDQVLNQAKSAGIVFIQPRINIYTSKAASPPKEPVKRDKEMNGATAATRSSNESEKSSSDHHSIIIIEDVGPYGDVQSPRDKGRSPPKAKSILTEPTTQTDVQNNPATEPRRVNEARLPNGGADNSEEVPCSSQRDLLPDVSFAQFENKVAEVDAILTNAVNDVVYSQSENVCSTRKITDEKFDGGEDDDGMDEELSKLAESERFLRQELDSAKLMSSRDSANRQGEYEQNSKFITDGFETDSLDSSASSSSSLSGLSEESLQANGQTSGSAPAYEYEDQSPLYSLITDDRDVRRPFSQNNGSKWESDPPSDATNDLALLHSRMTREIEMLHLDEYKPQMDDGIEEIEIVFVEKGFMAEEFFRYGESKGMLFNWIPRPTETKCMTTAPPDDDSCSDLRSGVEFLYEIHPLSNDKARLSDNQPERVLSLSQKKVERIVMSEKDDIRKPDRQPNKNRYKVSGQEVISLLHIEDPAELSSFRNKRSSCLPPNIPMSIPTERKMTRIDQGHFLLKNRPGRTGFDPPGDCVSAGAVTENRGILANGLGPESLQALDAHNSITRSKSTSPTDMKLEAVSSDEAAFSDLKNRIKAIFNRSAVTSHDASDGDGNATRHFQTDVIPIPPSHNSYREECNSVVSPSWSDLSKLVSMQRNRRNESSSPCHANEIPESFPSVVVENDHIVTDTRDPNIIEVEQYHNKASRDIIIVEQPVERGASNEAEKHASSTLRTAKDSMLSKKAKKSQSRLAKISPKFKLPGWNLARSAACAMRKRDKRRKTRPINDCKASPMETEKSVGIGKENTESPSIPIEQLPSKLFFVPLYPSLSETTPSLDVRPTVSMPGDSSGDVFDFPDLLL